MKRWQPLLSCYLALCLVFATVAGLSPRLHVWEDHGGSGPLHVHLGSGEIVYLNLPAVGKPQVRVSKPSQIDSLFSAFQLTGAALRHEQPFKLFGLEASDVYRSVGHWLAQAFQLVPHESQSGNGSHSHHGLSQLLLSGALELAILFFAMRQAPRLFRSFVSLLKVRIPLADWNAQTASRGPPFSSFVL